MDISFLSIPPSEEIESLFYNKFSYLNISNSYVQLDSSDTGKYVCRSSRKLSRTSKRQCKGYFLMHGLKITSIRNGPKQTTFRFRSSTALDFKSNAKQTKPEITSNFHFIFLVDCIDSGMFWTLKFRDSVHPIKVFVDDEDFTYQLTGSSRLTRYAYWFLSRCSPQNTSPKEMRIKFKKSQRDSRIQEEYKFSIQQKLSQVVHPTYKSNGRSGLGFPKQPTFSQGPSTFIPDKGQTIYNKMVERFSPSAPKIVDDSNPSDERMPTPLVVQDSEQSVTGSQINTGVSINFDYSILIQNELSDPLVMRAAVLYLLLRSDRQISSPFDEYTLGHFLKSKGMALDGLSELINKTVGDQRRSKRGDPRSGTPPVEQMMKHYELLYTRR